MVSQLLKILSLSPFILYVINMVPRRSKTGITNIVPRDGILLPDGIYVSPHMVYVSLSFSSCIEKKNGQNPTILLSLAEFRPGKQNKVRFLKRCEVSLKFNDLVGFGPLFFFYITNFVLFVLGKKTNFFFSSTLNNWPIH